MFVLLMGYRRGIREALQRQGVPFVIWSGKEIPWKAGKNSLVVKPYPQSKEELISQLGEREVTHIIAGTEDSVFPASQARLWLDARRNSHSIILKCTDKLKMKEYLRDKSTPMTPFIGGGKGVDASTIIKELGLPIVSKPRKSSGGRGVKIIDNKSDLEKELGRDKIFEKIIKGSEGSVESVIIDGEVKFSNITEYKRLGHCNLVPGHYSDTVKEGILDLNKKVIKSLRIKWGMTHLEFYLTDKGILFGEIALRPPGGYIIDAMEIAYGESFWDLFVKVELGLDILKFPERIKYSSSYLIHPGVGIVESISGEKDVLNIKSLEKIKLSVKAGDEVTQRVGVGQNCGFAFFSNDDKDKLNTDIDNFEKTLVVKLKPKVK